MEMGFSRFHLPFSLSKLAFPLFLFLSTPLPHVCSASSSSLACGVHVMYCLLLKEIENITYGTRSIHSLSVLLLTISFLFLSLLSPLLLVLIFPVASCRAHLGIGGLGEGAGAGPTLHLILFSSLFRIFPFFPPSLFYFFSIFPFFFSPAISLLIAPFFIDKY